MSQKFLVLLISLTLFNYGLSISGVKRRRLDEFEEDDDETALFGNGSPSRFCNVPNENSITKKQMDSHIRRFVSLFLRISKLKDENLSGVPEEDIIDARVYLTISAKNLALLQKLSRGEIQAVDIADLDDIICKMFYRPHMEAVSDVMSRWFGWFPSLTMSQFFIIAIMVTSLYYYHLHGLKYAIAYILLALTFLDALLKYSQLLKDAQLKGFLASHRHTTTDCNPSTRGYFTIIWANFFGDDCFSTEIYKDVVIEEVSFVHCLLQTYLITFLELPFLHLGKAVGGFTHVLSERFGVFQYVMYPVILGTIVGPVLFFLVALLRGSGFNVSTYFGSFKINPECNSRSNSARNEEVPQIGPSQLAPVVNVVINNTSRKIARIAGEGLKIIKIKDKKITPHLSERQSKIRRVTSQPALRAPIDEGDEPILRDRKTSAPVPTLANTDFQQLDSSPLSPFINFNKPLDVKNDISEDAVAEIRPDGTHEPVALYSSNPNSTNQESPLVNTFQKLSAPSEMKSELIDANKDFDSESSSSDFEILHEIETIRAQVKKLHADSDSDYSNNDEDIGPINHSTNKNLNES